MSADRFAEIERLFHEVVSRRPDERRAFLDQACGEDTALRLEVESLLSFQTNADGFLSRTALEEAARTGNRPWEPDSWPTIPGYTVRQVLGEGGMGVVYLAEQEKPFRRLVALKLIKPGMDTRQVVARFETERQALALMDHPNIAAVFDAGSTHAGRPYFVMEYVDGVSITDYCDRQRLSTRDRLALFVQVCAAVQHAHQKGVIHRDLKPSNVLVTERDGQPLPKVIDFGTAKAVGGTWNATATQGGQGMVLGTLEYMSPEQAALSADIDTATDVYSLGVLLYELLVGRLPFDTAELRAAGYDEIRRVIRESDPPKPSVRVEHRSDKSGAAARARQTDAPGLTRQLRGDLDWITLKALEKDRTRRYATAAAFATDIARFLEDQPVEARPPSSTYRIRKFTRRNRLAVAAAVMTIVTILTIGVTVSAGLYWRVESEAMLQRQHAVASTREAEHARHEAELQLGQAIKLGELRSAADRLAAEANRERASAVAARTVAESEGQKALDAAAALGAALKESNYHAYVANLAAAAGDLRIGAVPEARARLLTVSEALRGWEWQHLFAQTDESTTSFATTAPPCVVSVPAFSRMALSLDADGESLLLRRCKTLERWNVAALTRTAWTAPPLRTLWILAENARGQILTLHGAAPDAPDPSSYWLILSDRSGSAAAVTLGPIARQPNCADISPDGARVVFGLRATPSSGDVFEVWNIATARLEFRLRPAPPVLPYERLTCMIRFSPDGRRVATSGATVHVWDVATETERASDSLEAGAFHQPIAFSRSGNQLAIGRASGLVDVLDLTQSAPTLIRLSADVRAVEEPSSEADRMLRAVLRSKGEVTAVAFLPDGQTVVSGTSTTVGVWDLRQSRRVRVLSGHSTDVAAVAVSVDGRRIYSVDITGVVRIWPSSSEPAVVRIPGSSLQIRPFSMSASGTVIATETFDNALTAIRFPDLHQDVIRTGTGISATLSNSAVLSPDGLRIFAGEPGGSIRTWTIETKESIAVKTGTNAASLLTLSPSGALLAFTHRQNESDHVSVWDALTMKQLAEVDIGRFTGPISMLFRDEDTLLISCVSPGPSRILIWNWRNTARLATLELKLGPGLEDARWRLAVSPDRRRIALFPSQMGKPSPVSIWDGNLNAEIGRLPIGDYAALAFSSDGRRLVSVGHSETVVRVWDAERFLPLLTLQDTDSHRGGVAFTSAGQIVAGRTGGGLTIWESEVRRR